MQLFRYREDRIPVAIFVAYFALDVMVFFMAESLAFLAFWLVLGIIPKACIAAWNHHHQHLMTFKPRVLNRLLEVVYAFHTGVTSHAWVLHHVVGHHQNYLDQERDESRWKRKSGNKMGMIEYSFSVMLTAYPRSFRVGLRHRKHMRVFLGMALAVATLLGLAFWYNPVNALMVFALPMALALFFTAMATYKHHSGLETDNEYEASYNILNPLYNVCTGNLGYHTAHHVKCGVHWSRLPRLHAKMAAKIPAELYLKPGLPWSIVSTPDPPPEAPLSLSAA